MSTEDKTLVQIRNADGVSQAAHPIAGGFARPNPGGRSKPPPVSPQPEPAPSPSWPPPSSPPQAAAGNSGFFQPGSQAGVMAGQGWGYGVQQGRALDNPLLAAASGLLERMAQLSAQNEAHDVMSYRDGCVQQLQIFEQQLLHNDSSEETRYYARYVLCTVMDELVNKTHWGSGVWSNQSLLSQFHGETGGGERFFQLLEYLQQSPAKNLHLLELMYVCLGLGFEGKYRLDARGYAQLEALRDNLFHLIRMQKGEPERDLSPHWQRVTQRRNPLSRYLPLWVVVAVVGVLMLGTYSGFSYLLNERSSALLTELERPLSDDANH